MERFCEICGVIMPRGSGFLRDDIASHMRLCGKVGKFVCPHCRKHSDPLHVALNLKNLELPKRCPFCERRISLTNDSGLFEESYSDSLSQNAQTEVVEESVQSEPRPSQNSELKVETPEKPKKKVFRWSEQK